MDPCEPIEPDVNSTDTAQPFQPFQPFQPSRTATARVRQRFATLLPELEALGLSYLRLCARLRQAMTADDGTFLVALAECQPLVEAWCRDGVERRAHDELWMDAFAPIAPLSAIDSAESSPRGDGVDRVRPTVPSRRPSYPPFPPFSPAPYLPGTPGTPGLRSPTKERVDSGELRR